MRKRDKENNAPPTPAVWPKGILGGGKMPAGGGIGKLPEGVGKLRLTSFHKRTMYYGVDLPATVERGATFPLFEKVGDSVYTNLTKPHTVLGEAAVIYRLRTGIMPEEEVPVGDIQRTVWYGALWIAVNGSGQFLTPVSLLPFCLFPFHYERSPFEEADNALKIIRNPAGHIFGMAGQTRDGNVIFSMTNEALAVMPIPIYLHGDCDRWEKPDELTGHFTFHRAFTNTREVTLYLMMDAFTEYQMDGDGLNAEAMFADVLR